MNEVSQGEGPLQSLSPDQLCRRCDPSRFEFETTEHLEDHTTIIGQPRAMEAIKLAIGIRRPGYNLFAVGPPGIGRHTLVRRYLEDAVVDRPAPSDWCYVNNFEQARQPRALELPAGMGQTLRDDMTHLVDQLRTALSAAFESEEYQQRQETVQEEAKEEQERKLEELSHEAKEQGLALLRTPSGFTLAPKKGEEVLSPGEVAKLPDKDRKRLEQAAAQLHEKLLVILRGLPKLLREMQRDLQEMNKEVADFAAADLIKDFKEKYRSVDAVISFIDQLQQNIVSNVQAFVPGESGLGSTAGLATDRQPALPSYQSLSPSPYAVNVIVDHRDSDTAPIIYEENPTYPNLIGRVEHVAQMGTLLTDFTLIRAGALHRANGGFLVIDARVLLQRPFAWEGLKRALRAREINIEAPGESLGLLTTVSLEPEPIPLQVSVILIGSAELYYLLDAYDPEFRKLFKVVADFDNQMDRDGDSELRYARLIAFLAQREKTRPLDRSGVARVIEQSARTARDSGKLNTHLESLADLLRESDYWAGVAGADTISREHVQRTIDEQIFRADRLRERIQEHIADGTLLISTEGVQTGQINGLAVYEMGQISFGKPDRITARVRLGSGEIVDIERETEMGGPIHSKGVLILTGFLNGRYARDIPLSLTASLVFEQSYGGVEGDSASCAELIALLSAIAEVPVRQSLAITGSINQHGEVQPIGGANEKIEGFFDVCQKRGLTGDQGVVLAASNVRNLMLRDDVVQAARDGRFSVYPVETVDQCIELMTGLPAGEPGEDGHYPDGSFNARVEKRLEDFAARRRAFVGSNDQSEK